jgi:hypothetical protein
MIGIMDFLAGIFPKLGDSCPRAPPCQYGMRISRKGTIPGVGRAIQSRHTRDAHERSTGRTKWSVYDPMDRVPWILPSEQHRKPWNDYPPNHRTAVHIPWAAFPHCGGDLSAGKTPLVPSRAGHEPHVNQREPKCMNSGSKKVHVNRYYERSWIFMNYVMCTVYVVLKTYIYATSHPSHLSTVLPMSPPESCSRYAAIAPPACMRAISRYWCPSYWGPRY